MRHPDSIPLTFGKDDDPDWQDEQKWAKSPHKYCLDCRAVRNVKYRQDVPGKRKLKYGDDAEAIVEIKKQELKKKRSRICLGKDKNVPKPRKGAPNHWCQLCSASHPGGRERLILGPHFFRLTNECLKRGGRVRLKTLEPDMKAILELVGQEACFSNLTLEGLFERFKVFKRSPCYLAKSKGKVLVHQILGTDAKECVGNTEQTKREALYLNLASGVWQVTGQTEKRKERFVRVSPEGMLYESATGLPPWRKDGQLSVVDGTLWKGSIWRLKIQGSQDQKLVWSSKYSKKVRSKKEIPDKMVWVRVSAPPETDL